MLQCAARTKNSCNYTLDGVKRLDGIEKSVICTAAGIKCADGIENEAMCTPQDIKCEDSLKFIAI